MNDLYSITQENSYVVWLDLFIPMYKKKFWELTGMVSFAQGSGMRVRMASIFKKSSVIKINNIQQKLV